MSYKLTIKDLVTVGVFAVIYFFCMFAIGMIGMVPILFLGVPALVSLLLGTLIMLFMIKVPKFGGLFILGMVAPTLMFVMGHPYVIFVHGIVIMLIAELIRYLGKYTSVKWNIAAYAVFSTWLCGSMLEMLVVKEQYIALTRPMMGDEYVNTFEKLISCQSMAIIYIGTIIAGIIGGYIGSLLLKKHLKKAGIA